MNFSHHELLQASQYAIKIDRVDDFISEPVEISHLITITAG